MTSEQIITVGESPNHESIFDRHLFPLSAGVANLQGLTDHLNHLPADATAKEEREGFDPIAQLLVECSKTKG